MDHPWQHLQGQDMCKNQEFGSSQRTAERRELCLSPYNCGTSHNPLPFPTYLQARGPKPRDVSLRKSAPRQVRLLPVGLSRYSGHPSLAQGPGKTLDNFNGSLVPQFPVVFLTVRGPSRNLKGLGVSLLAPTLPGCHGSHHSTMAAIL